jgi:hypothetical protein
MKFESRMPAKLRQKEQNGADDSRHWFLSGLTHDGKKETTRVVSGTKGILFCPKQTILAASIASKTIQKKKNG